MEFKVNLIIGVNVGKSGDEDLIGVIFLMFLNIRNNYLDIVKVVYLEVIVVEVNFWLVYWK